jgi:hypothetical protein
MPEREARDQLHPPERDENVRVIVLLACALIGVVAIVLFVLWPVARIAERKMEAPSEDAFVSGSGPALTISSQEELRSLRAEEQKRLESYGWVDRSRGIVHVPIERAMQLLVERGSAVGEDR